MTRHYLEGNYEVLCASSGKEGLELLRDTKVDLVLLDLDMPGMDGLTLSNRIHEVSPDTEIVFTTGYAHYSLEAWNTVAKAFVLKPVSEEDHQKALNKIHDSQRHSGKSDGTADPSGSVKPLEAKCFGNFEIFHNGKPIHFARKKSKEMLAYLIDRRGAMITTGELRVVLWDEDGDTEEKKGYVRVLANDIRKGLDAVGVSGFLLNDVDCYGIDVSMLSCDYLDFINGDRKAKRLFRDEYMMQYSWAEGTLANLMDIVN